MRNYITKETIKNGFDSGTISIKEGYAGCLGICCKIGNCAFYFVGIDDSLTIEEYWENYSLDMTVDMIFNILKSEQAAEENGIFAIEYQYYVDVLKSQ